MNTSLLPATPAVTCETVGRLSERLAEMTDPDAAIAPRHRWYLPIRFVLDLLATLVLLIAAVPVVMAAAAAIKLTSPGPVFYRQQRVGKDGRVFPLIKLRTMVNDAEALSGPVWSDQNDARVTPVGRVLRKTHLDELPQLVNVLLGHMSLIGPRPERPEFVSTLEWQLPHYRTRLKLRPGITGLSQLMLPPDSDLDSVRRKLVFDMYYIRSVSPWLDVRILAATGWYLVRTSWQSVWSLFSLPGSQTIERSLNAVIPEESPEPASHR